MARRHEAERLLREGFGPAEIAAEMRISVKSVLQYLFTRVGEGELKLSDLFFGIPKKSRQLFESAIRERDGRLTVPWRKLPKNSYSREELDLFLALRSHSLFRGDLYEYVSDIEVFLHALIKSVLISHYGKKDWWRKGVSLEIRKDCVGRREEDDDPVDEDFAYTTLIHLKKILDKNWTPFQNILPKRWTVSKPDFVRGLDRLNAIRNAVMHPVKERKWTEDDFDFVRDFLRGVFDSIDNFKRRRSNTQP